MAKKSKKVKSKSVKKQKKTMIKKSNRVEGVEKGKTIFKKNAKVKVKVERCK